MRRSVIAFYRIGLGALVLTALVIQFVVSFRAAPFPPLNYFSFFTNLSNIYGGALVFLYCGFGPSESLRASKARGAAVVYLAITGVVYATLLVNEPLGMLLPWVNVLLHYVMPVVFVGDWLIDPPRHALARSEIRLWLVFPIAFLVYSVIRGAIISWYPYPFLNPDRAGGYGGVAIAAIAIAAGFIVVSLAVIWLGNARRFPNGQQM
jgi:hypothetical protein